MPQIYVMHAFPGTQYCAWAELSQQTLLPNAPVYAPFAALDK
jgi:hypothetical protein